MSKGLFDLRNFYFYSCGNKFSGSLNGFNYRIDPADNALKVITWHGMLCSRKAEIESRSEFPLTEEGFEQMVQWLEAEYEK